MTRVAIIHGTKGSPSGNWFPWLAAELSSRGIEAIVPQMPTPEGQSLSSWRAAFNEQFGVPDSRTVLIGHSVGAVFVLRLLEELSHSVAASILVCPFVGSLGLPEYDLLNKSFVESPFNWHVIRKNAGTSVVFLGSDDPYVPSTQGLAVANNLQVDACCIANGGHLNAESGLHAFPALLDWLSQQMSLK